MRIEIKEPGTWGKTVYIYENNKVKRPGMFGDVVYYIENGYVKEPKMFGRNLLKIKGNELVEVGKVFFPKTLYTFSDDAVYKGRDLIYKLVVKNNNGVVENPQPQGKKSDVSIKISVSQITPFDNVQYIEVKAYSYFFNKYKVIKHPNYMADNMYAKFELSLRGVNNPKEFHRKLVEEGFYEKADVNNMLSIYKVPEIKNVAEQLGIKVSGKKEDIIKSIELKATIEDVESILGEEVLVVSQKAKNYLKDNAIDIEFYNADFPNLSLEDYREKRKVFSFNDLKWQKYQNDLKENFLENASRTYGFMGILLENEGKFEEALLIHLKSLYVTINGTYEYSRLERIGFDKDLVKDTTIILGRFLSDPIYRLKDYFNEEMIDSVYELKIPFAPVDKSLFKKLLNEIFTLNIDWFKWEEKISANFRKKIKEQFC